MKNSKKLLVGIAIIGLLPAQTNAILPDFWGESGGETMAPRGSTQPVLSGRQQVQEGSVTPNATAALPLGEWDDLGDVLRSGEWDSLVAEGEQQGNFNENPTASTSFSGGNDLEDVFQNATNTAAAPRYESGEWDDLGTEGTQGNVAPRPTAVAPRLFPFRASLEQQERENLRNLATTQTEAVFKPDPNETAESNAAAAPLSARPQAAVFENPFPTLGVPFIPTLDNIQEDGVYVRSSPGDMQRVLVTGESLRLALDHGPMDTFVQELPSLGQYLIAINNNNSEEPSLVPNRFGQIYSVENLKTLLLNLSRGQAVTRHAFLRVIIDPDASYNVNTYNVREGNMISQNSVSGRDLSSLYMGRFIKLEKQNPS